MDFRGRFVNDQYQPIHNTVKKILIVSANPQDRNRRLVHEEAREIQAGLERAKIQEHFAIIITSAERFDDLRRAILDQEPQIIDLYGYGEGNQGFALEDNTGKIQLVSSESLSSLFSLFPSIECVLLNGCYDEAQAEAISQHIDYVIGINQALGERAAIEFAVGFYHALAAGRSYEDAYKFGCLPIDNLENISESAMPIFIHRKNTINADILQSNSSPLPRPFRAVQPVSLEMPEGTMSSESQFYIERSSDLLALEIIKQQGVTIIIKGPRQMGKSSLLIRTIDAAVAVGKWVVFLDFQLFDKATLNNADNFFRQFCCWLTDELEMADKVDEYWQTPLGYSQRCTRYVNRYILKDFGKPLVLAMDEVESIFDSEFRSDFFAMLRSWHNSRAITPIWKNLDLVLATSTEPYQFIDNLHESPFNVGVAVNLEDFTTEQVADLNRRHGSPLNSSEERQLMALLNGHPYLVRLALYVIASQRLSTAELFTNATADNGPFGNHLRNYLFRLHNKTELVQGMLQVIRQNICDERVFFRLHGAGLVRREGHKVIPRCQLYAEYFREKLRG
ncbi:hypothetical protein A6S26_28970 [Nostoc sp. ATCC 43529]|nr:hypothetical protein A6S26_28970 [Nostoc sp. ATCC 43529]